ncbi:hypothetical protein [Salibacterium aidingense]|uniref:hypothetical protein n=1 Tax=Salibacterium aidingense TaxID=384933 RepID=UPI003BC758A4
MKKAVKVVNILNEKQLQQLAEAQWNYQLEINEQPLEEFENDPRIAVDEDTLEVRLVETQREYSPLPNQVHRQGKLENFHEGIQVTPDSFEKSALPEG